MAGWKLGQEVRTAINESSLDMMNYEDADLFLDGFLAYLRK